MKKKRQQARLAISAPMNNTQFEQFKDKVATESARLNMTQSNYIILKVLGHECPKCKGVSLSKFCPDCGLKLVD